MRKSFHLARQRAQRQAMHVLAITALVLATGCASVSAPQQSGTLIGYEQLRLQADGSRAWRSEQSDRYETVLIDPSAIVFESGVQLDTAQREELRLALAGALTEQFASAGLQIGKPVEGRRGVQLKATVTGAELANPAVNVLSTLLLLAPVSRGGLTVEIEAIDSAAGQRVAALAFSGKAGVENFSSAYSAMGHAKLQAKSVAARFVALFDGQAATTTR